MRRLEPWETAATRKLSEPTTWLFNHLCEVAGLFSCSC